MSFENEAVKLSKLFDDALEKIHEINTGLYRQKLEAMTDAGLKEEFEDRIGYVLSDFDRIMIHSGRDSVIDYMVDSYQVNHYEELFGKNNPSAIEMMRKKLDQIKTAQSSCLDENGIFIKPGYKYRYNMLVKKAREFKESIDFMDSIK